MIVKGQKVNDRYEIIKNIGEGGMANVYLAHDVILDRNVAIKVLRGDLANDEKFVRRFQREALSASSLSHPNIVEMYDVGEDNGTYYIVMEYVEGKTLKQLIKKRGNLTLSETIDIMLQLTDGISHAHDSYIIHRDLKPQNILIQDNGEIKITDFGIAMALNSTQLTQTNSVMGSVHYLPPEQASGKGSTIKSDIYSMGILFYELLTGSLPFKGENAVEIALKHMKEPLPSIKDKIPNIPQSVENVILKATAKNPKNRYSNAHEMHDDLLTVLNADRINEPVHVYQYKEHDQEDTKVVPVITDANKAKVTEELARPIIDEETKKSNVWIWILSGIFGLAILAMAWIFIIFPKINDIPDVKIPDVTNMTIVDAEAKLKKAGFNVSLEIEKIESDTVEPGLVVKTSPAIGRTVKKGTTITLYESLGQLAYEIEDYIGKNYIEVKTILETVHNLVVLVEKKDVDIGDEKKYDEQEIIGQSLEKGTKVGKGSKITLYIPNIYEMYPDMVGEGWTIDDVKAFATKYELVLTIIEQKTSEVPAGTLIYQSRTVNDRIIKGASLKVTVAVENPVEEENNDSNPSDSSGN